MLQPKRTKFRKVHKGRNTGLAHRGSTVSFGSIAIKATERGRMTARQIEAARRTISRRIKRGGKIFIRVFPDKPITEKPLEVRMGKGKGSCGILGLSESNQVRSCTKLKVLTKN
jgi:large subunit ribosomal protein L16